MDYQYRYWKTKRHVIHFVLLMVAIAALTTVFWVDVFQTMQHVTPEGIVDPDYDSPLTIVVVILSMITLVALVLFIFDLFYYFSMKKRLRKMGGNNIEINVKTDKPEENAALEQSKAKFIGSGLVADINAQSTDLDIEFTYQIKNISDTKETFPLFLYILYKPLGLGLLALLLMCVGLNMVFNINHPQNAVLPIIISASISVLIIILFFVFLVMRANKAKKKAVEFTKEVGVRIYPDHIEQFNIVTKNDQEAEIRYKVPFLKMKHLETKRAFYFRSYNNGQVVALRLDKSEMPEEAIILIKTKSKSSKR